jgi:hypothetical protein
MSVLKKIQKADIFWKKAMMFAVLAVLAVPLFILVAYNAKSKMKELGAIKSPEGIKTIDFKIGLDDILQGLETPTSSSASTSLNN